MTPPMSRLAVTLRTNSAAVVKRTRSSLNRSRSRRDRIGNRRPSMAPTMRRRRLRRVHRIRVLALSILKNNARLSRPHNPTTTNSTVNKKEQTDCDIAIDIDIDIRRSMTFLDCI